MNKSDSERIASYLENLGYQESSEKEADLVVITTCGVRQSAENRIYGIIPKLKKQNPSVKIILTGCLAGREDVKKRIGEKVDIWLPVKELEKLKALLENCEDDFCNTSIYNSKYKTNDDYLKLKPKYNSVFSAFVPIGNGCDNFCTYCVVPYARGSEKYRSAEEILEEVKILVKKGYKEIALIAQNVNSYKSDANVLINTNDADCESKKVINFSKLLQMVNDIKGDFWIRFATSHPKDMSDELIETIASRKKICHHIHLPAQAGDDDVLHRMNRRYTRGHYLGLIKKIKDRMPDVALTTDIIVGFPGETRQQFDKTKELFEEVQYDMAYIAQYSPRPGTAALKFEDDIETEEKKRREEELMEVLRRTAAGNNKKYIGKKYKILIDKKNKRGNFVGRTETNKNVEIINPENIGRNLIGEFVAVKIEKADDFGLAGKIIC